MRGLMFSDEAVSNNVGYIMYSGIFLIFFATMFVGVDALLVEGPNEVVVEDGFSDVGNMMSTMFTDMYLIAPENGEINTSYSIPERVGKDYYVINANVDDSNQIIEVESMDSDISVSVTISGIAGNYITGEGIAGGMQIEGTALSSDQDHRVVYDSRQ